MLFGDKPTCCCMIKCNGQGPVVNITPEIMDFGEVVLLKELNRFFTLMNESPIPAQVTASIVRKLV